MNSAVRKTLLLLLAGGTLVLAGCERPDGRKVQQLGYRGTGMEQVDNTRILAATADRHVAPKSEPAAPAEGPKAGQVFQNVKVLGDLSVAEFTRHMNTITNWVSPKEGCAYCHNLQNLADDSKYTKVVARRMLQMTQTVNTQWKSHVGSTGVTCYTCHRGNPVPENVWFTAPRTKMAQGLLGDDAEQNRPLKVVGLTSLPYDPFTSYLTRTAAPIRVGGTTALPTGNRSSTKQAEFTYALMMHFSQALGVNCTYCHNTHSFVAWDSPPQRATAWHGIQMARSLNEEYLIPLTASFPQSRLGEMGDVAKVNCATCHQGANKPLFGAKMLDAHPELGRTAAPAAAALPPTTSTAEMAVLYFAVGSAQLAGDASTGMQNLVDALKANPRAKVSISGYHSASGDATANAELAKNRAMGVRDALKAAGIAETRVALQKPTVVQANAAGEDPQSRRVEVTVAK